MLEKLKERRNDEGFTLIELLIVIIILAILATIVIFAVGTTTKNAALASCKSTVKTVQTALEAYKAQTSAAGYPTKITTLTKTATPTKGPWLKQAPNQTAATVTKFGWVLITYTHTKGTFKVETKGTKTTPLATSSPTVCTGA
jgi:prepilin-type N-terminal cleavage/methylation domain-containing protein